MDNYPHNMFLLCETACSDSIEGKLAREELLDYYQMRLFELYFDKLFAPRLDIGKLRSVMNSFKPKLLDMDSCSKDRIPFLPVINSALWKPEILLQLITKIEYEEKFCDPVLFQLVRKRLLVDDYDYLDIDDPMYFLSDVECLAGIHKDPVEFGLEFFSDHPGARPLTLSQLVMLLLMHPQLVSESNFISFGTKMVVGTATFNPYVSFDERKIEGHFECRIANNNSAASRKAAKPSAHARIILGKK